jgi:hypothetical protein
MRHRIVITIPYAVKIGRLVFMTKRNVGLSFDNLANFNFIENTSLSTKEELDNWMQQHGYTSVILEYTWAAVQSYYAHKKMPITREKFVDSMGRIDKSTWEQIIDAFNHSRMFGVKDKKKVGEGS